MRASSHIKKIKRFRNPRYSSYAYRAFTPAVRLKKFVSSHRRTAMFRFLKFKQKRQIKRLNVFVKQALIKTTQMITVPHKKRSLQFTGRFFKKRIATVDFLNRRQYFKKRLFSRSSNTEQTKIKISKILAKPLTFLGHKKEETKNLHTFRLFKKTALFCETMVRTQVLLLEMFERAANHPTISFRLGDESHYAKPKTKNSEISPNHILFYANYQPDYPFYERNRRPRYRKANNRDNKQKCDYLKSAWTTPRNFETTFHFDAFSNFIIKPLQNKFSEGAKVYFVCRKLLGLFPKSWYEDEVYKTNDYKSQEELLAELAKQEPEFDESQADEAMTYYMQYKAVDESDLYWQLYLDRPDLAEPSKYVGNTEILRFDDHPDWRDADAELTESDKVWINLNSFFIFLLFFTKKTTLVEPCADLFLMEQPASKKEIIKQDDFAQELLVKKEEEICFTGSFKSASLLEIAEEPKPVKRTWSPARRAAYERSKIEKQKLKK